MRKKSLIQNIRAREILDSRGNPTVEVWVETGFGDFLASAPSGASKGRYEVLELRDGGARYNGKGVLQAVRNINEIITPKLKGADPADQQGIDDILISLDATEDKSRIGANAVLPVSMACCRAAAAAENLFLWQYLRKIFNFQFSRLRQGFGGQAISNAIFPKACFNIINGGVHAGSDLVIQEFMAVPQFKKFEENLEAVSRIYHGLKNILQEKYGRQAVNLGDEGGFAPPMAQTKEALDLIIETIRAERLEDMVQVGLDCAASQFFEGAESRSIYTIDGQKKDREGLLGYYQDLCENYPIIFLEDPFAEDDFESWEKIMSKCQTSNVYIVGDDLTVSNPKRIKMAQEKNLCNAMILKMNQIGTITETLEAAKLARQFGWKIIVSHRSGETNDDFIADLAVGINSDFIKSGAPARGERTAKYNRLLKIEEELRSGI